MVHPVVVTEGRDMAFRKGRAAVVERRGTERTPDITAELSAGVDHLRSAAGQAAAAAAETLAPRIEQAKVALAPTVEATRGAVTPRLEAAREAVAPRVEAARDALTPRIEAAREATRETVRPAWDSTVAVLAPAVALAAEKAQLGRSGGGETVRAVGRRAARKAARNAARAEKRGRGARRQARRQARVQARTAALVLRGRQPSRRWGFALLVFVLGIAAGVAGGLLARRAAEPAWEEYDPVSGNAYGSGPGGAAGGAAGGGTDGEEPPARLSAVTSENGSAENGTGAAGTGAAEDAAGAPDEADRTDQIPALGDGAATTETIVVAPAGSVPLPETSEATAPGTDSPGR